MAVKPCVHRLVREGEGRCWLETARSADEEGDRSLVFQNGGEMHPVLCGEALSAACPFRRWDEGTGRARMVACPHCGRRHREGSSSQMLCETWSSIKAVLKEMRREGQSYYPHGTTASPYDERTPALIRRLVWQRLKSTILRRDRYRCQDCGVDFGGRRRKVFDPRLNRGRGGYRWESLEVHHIISRADGGTDHPGNLKTLCPSCHRGYTSEQSVARTIRNRERREALRQLHEEGFVDEPEYDPRD